VSLSGGSKGGKGGEGVRARAGGEGVAREQHTGRRTVRPLTCARPNRLASTSPDDADWPSRICASRARRPLRTSSSAALLRSAEACVALEAAPCTVRRPTSASGFEKTTIVSRNHPAAGRCRPRCLHTETQSRRRGPSNPTHERAPRMGHGASRKSPSPPHQSHETPPRARTRRIIKRS
jgi:hypothetical protein